MKKIYFILLVLFVTVVFPFNLTAQGVENFKQEGIASWYGREFEGRPTASGEIFDSSQLTAAHPSLPFGTILVVTNRHNNKSVTVRVNDRGPFVAARIIDVSMAAAEQLDMIVTGTAPVVVESIERLVVSQTTVGRQMQTPVTETQSAVPQTVRVVNAPEVLNVQPAASTIYADRQPVAVQAPQLRLTPNINIAPDRNYRLQIGSYRVARNAVEAFERLKNSGFNPAYERYTDGANSEYFRVVLAGIRGTDVQSTTERLSGAGFREALIREEN